MATVRKRHWTTAAGAERVAWVATYTDSKGIRRLKTFKTKKAADAWMVKAGGELASGIHVPESTTATIDKAAADWLTWCEGNHLERSTLHQYRNHVDRHIVPLIGRMKIAKLTVPLIEAFKDELLRTRSQPLAKKVLSSLKSLLKEAQRRGQAAHNVAHGVTVGTSSRRHRKHAEVGRDIPSPGEVKALLDAAEGPRWRALLAALVFTGLRASELRGLTWANVDLDGKMVHVRQRADRWGTIGSPKSEGSRRDIPMAPLLVNALKAWKLACPPGSDLAFPGLHGGVLSHGRLTAGLSSIQRAAGVIGEDGRPKYGAHAFRHFFASWLIDQGFSPKRVQSLLGHASITMTFDVYGHLFPQEDDHERFAAGELALVGG